MSELASRAQLRWAIVRAMAVIVPLTLMFGGVAANLAGGQSPVWYFSLLRPDWAPDPDHFAVLMPAVCFLSGLAASIVWYAKGNTLRSRALALFGAYLLLFLAWSPIFFAQRSLMAAMLAGIALILVGLVTLVLFWRIRTSAGLLLLPTLVIAAMIAVLSVTLYQNNPDGKPAQSLGSTALQPSH